MANQTNYKVFIQSRASQLFLISPNSWTQDVGQAQDFERVGKASDVARVKRLEDCDIVMSFGDQIYDVRISA
ncbi:MAG: hypothetical protein JWQ04_341 [Pedosphaera sp.]|nr:hypothetical protein [Pedosphaera sp.]